MMYQSSSLSNSLLFCWLRLFFSLSIRSFASLLGGCSAVASLACTIAKLDSSEV